MPGNWILFAAATAVFSAGKDVFSRIGLDSADEYLVSFTTWLFALPLLSLALCFSGIPVICPAFFPALLVSGIANTAATILYMKAMHSTDISICVPLVAFTPVFMLLTSPLILGEFPGQRGVLGIFFITAGSYFLQLEKGKTGFMAPFKALLYNRGARYMAIVAFIWSISANFDKMGILNSSPFFWSFSSCLFVILSMLPILHCHGCFGRTGKNFGSLALAGISHSLMLICQMTAVSMTLAAYVISIKRTSIVLVVLAGSLIFKEGGLKERLFGSALMLAGVMLITLF
ncbi:MAG: EamA family transporter [Candidatus Wallbacteria bacterium]|nr:EamA family transporter [Candidatus Wallbacteria bacterium]